MFWQRPPGFKDYSRHFSLNNDLMKKKMTTTLVSPQTGLPHQVEVGDEASLPEAIRQAVLSGLRKLPARPRTALLRIVQEEGYRGYTLYRLVSAETDQEGTPVCVIGPLVHHPESGSLKKRGDTIDVRYGDYAAEFFAGFFQKSPVHRKCKAYDELRLPKPAVAAVVEED